MNVFCKYLFALFFTLLLSSCIKSGPETLVGTLWECKESSTEVISLEFTSESSYIFKEIITYPHGTGYTFSGKNEYSYDYPNLSLTWIRENYQGEVREGRMEVMDKQFLLVK